RRRNDGLDSSKSPPAGSWDAAHGIAGRPARQGFGACTIECHGNRLRRSQQSQILSGRAPMCRRPMMLVVLGAIVAFAGPALAADTINVYTAWPESLSQP